MRVIARRSALSLITAGIGLSLLAGPAAAATRYVAPTGSGGGSCATPNHRTITAAITKAKAGDTIVVCPGTYVGALTIAKNGLTIRASKPGKAIVTVGRGTVEDVIWVKGADNVTVRGLKLLAPTKSCDNSVDTMIQVDGDANNVTLSGNTLDVKGTLSLGDCGYGVGVSIGVQSSGTVSGNRIIDFKDTAIYLAGVGTSATVAGNTVRYEHATYPATETPTDEGILVLSGASAIVEDNTVTSPPTAGHPAFGGTTRALAHGIHIGSVGAGTIVRRNTIVRSLDRGLLLEAASGLIVRANTLTDSFDVGLEAAGVTLSTFANNDVRANINEGIVVRSSSVGNTFSGNSAGGGSVGCLDESRGDGTSGTDNTWTDNVGSSDPTGICS